MEGTLRKRMLPAALAVAAVALALAAPAQSSSITTIGSFTDPRGDLPNHPGTP
jgi:hypothetical protein